MSSGQEGWECSSRAPTQQSLLVPNRTGAAATNHSVCSSAYVASSPRKAPALGWAPGTRSLYGSMEPSLLLDKVSTEWASLWCRWERKGKQNKAMLNSADGRSWAFWLFLWSPSQHWLDVGLSSIPSQRGASSHPPVGPTVLIIGWCHATRQPAYLATQQTIWKKNPFLTQPNKTFFICSFSSLSLSLFLKCSVWNVAWSSCTSLSSALSYLWVEVEGRRWW